MKQVEQVVKIVFLILYVFAVVILILATWGESLHSWLSVSKNYPEKKNSPAKTFFPPVLNSGEKSI